jgi:6-pyruvoyltetrahydropterin/6-carboxytetrahydropterin synthase
MPHAPLAILTRRETFSASHRLLAHGLSDEENRALFGKCYHVNGHGHNYVLEVSVRGPVDAKTGIVMNLVELKQLIHEHVLSKVDHRHLNLDVEEFRALNPSAENIAYVVWQWLKPSLGALLHEVRLHETENNIAVYRGE